MVRTLQDHFKDYESCSVKKKFNSLQNDNFLDVTNFKTFVDDKSNVVELMISVFDMVEIHWVKRRKCWLLAFSPFPTVFSIGFFLRVFKSRDCVVVSMHL